jgi:predicted O-methyltransferase YrrM
VAVFVDGPSVTDYEFTIDWFSIHTEIWSELFRKIVPDSRKILEIGAYEGRATVWLIEHVLPPGGTIVCVDTWEGGEEHAQVDMREVERRYDHNVSSATKRFPGRKVVKRKSLSQPALYELVHEGHAGTFDFIYIDGSHQASDVMCDLVSAYYLCRRGGLMVCDDYLWGQGDNPAHTPKLAIDSFVNCFSGKVNVLSARLFQVYLLKR